MYIQSSAKNDDDPKQKKKEALNASLMQFLKRKWILIISST